MNATDVRTELGGRFDAPTLVLGMPLIVRARVAWAHDFVTNPALSAASQLLPGGSFTVFGAPIPRDSTLTSVGAELFLAPRWTALFKFDGEFANGSQTYGGSGTCAVHGNGFCVGSARDVAVWPIASVRAVQRYVRCWMDCVAKLESCSAKNFSRKQEAGDDHRFVYPQSRCRNRR